MKHTCVFSARRRHGVAVVYVAIIMIALMGIVGLAIDTAYVFLCAHRLQNAADAAALAGAQEIGFSTTQAKTDAVNTGADNTAAGASVQLDVNNDVTIGNYNRTNSTFSANTTPFNAVQVVAKRTSGSIGGPINLFFAPMFGITTSNVSRPAIAMNSPWMPGLLVLNATASPSVQLTGTGSNSNKINIPNGGAVVDSSSSFAIQWTGNPTITAASLSVVGNDTGASTVYPSGSFDPNSLYLADPYSSLPVPSQGTTQNGNNSPLPPGYYPNGLPAGTLAGGIYYVDGGISLKGNDTLTSNAGVMIYLHTGGISMKGTSSMSLTPMVTGTYAGITIYQDRSNSSADSFHGNPGSTTTGTIYLPDAAVTLAGNPGTFASQVIVNTLTIQGNAQLNINYNSSDNVQRHEAFLVQ